MYETLRAFDDSATEFINASLVAKFAEYYPNFFDNLDSEAHEHRMETTKRSQEGGADRNLRGPSPNLAFVFIYQPIFLKFAHII